MRYSQKQLWNLRSGQMVWRVLFWIEEGRFSGQKLAHSITPTWVVGKKVLHWFRHFETKKLQWSSMKMEVKNKASFRWEPDRPNMSIAGFLSDLQGHGAFSSKRHAERFVEEVYAGLHPDFTEDLKHQHEMDLDFDRWNREYDDSELYPEEGDEAWRRDMLDSGEHGHPLDRSWIESEGQGA